MQTLLKQSGFFGNAIACECSELPRPLKPQIFNSDGASEP